MSISERRKSSAETRPIVSRRIQRRPVGAQGHRVWRQKRGLPGTHCQNEPGDDSDKEGYDRADTEQEELLPDPEAFAWTRSNASSAASDKFAMEREKEEYGAFKGIRLSSFSYKTSYPSASKPSPWRTSSFTRSRFR